MPIIHVPEVLREKLGPEGARALVDLLNEAGRATRDDMISLVEERFSRRLAEELGKVREELSALETRVNERISALEVRFAEGLATAKTAFERRIGSAQTRLLLWSFAFWATLMAALFLRT